MLRKVKNCLGRLNITPIFFLSPFFFLPLHSLPSCFPSLPCCLSHFLLTFLSPILIHFFIIPPLLLSFPSFLPFLTPFLPFPFPYSPLPLSLLPSSCPSFLSYHPSYLPPFLIHLFLYPSFLVSSPSSFPSRSHNTCKDRI